MNARNLHTSILRGLITVIIGLGLNYCSSPEDENYAWLIGLAAILPPPGTEVEPADVGSGETESVPFSIQIDDLLGNPDFLFETTQTVDVFITVVDAVAPVEGSRVRVFELVDNTTGEQVLFQAATDVNGNATGSITINRAVAAVIIEYQFAGQTYRQQVDLTMVQEIRRTLNIMAMVGPVPVMDRDGDGIPDDMDHYPDDPGRATMVTYPSAPLRYYTIAFEDLYPRQGDADFNDYVLRLKYEEDLDAQGRIVGLRGEIVHAARGAGYKHTLHLTLPGADDARLQLMRVDELDNVVHSEDRYVADFSGVELMPRSDTTISMSNTAKGANVFRTGQRVNFEITPAAPLRRADLGSMPYDLFLRVLDTGHDIHFAGRYVDEDGADRYVDSAGFPWALMVPGDWRWPYERGNIHPAYPLFDDWYGSGGENARNWYDFPEIEAVVPVF